MVGQRKRIRVKYAAQLSRRLDYARRGCGLRWLPTRGAIAIDAPLYLHIGEYDFFLYPLHLRKLLHNEIVYLKVETVGEQKNRSDTHRELIENQSI